MSAAAARASGETLVVAYFDGRSARPRPVRIRIGGGRLLIDGEADGAGPALQVPLVDVQWPERSRHGQRVAHLRDGGSLQAPDALAWDAWARGSGIGESLVVKAQQHWRSTFVAAALLLMLCAAGYAWGVPWLGRAALAVVPASADRAIGEAAQRSIETYLLLPSRVPASRQAAVRAAFAAAVARVDPSHRLPAYTLNFATSAVRPETTASGGGTGNTVNTGTGGTGTGTGSAARTRLGANAFALPGGFIYVTDDMLTLLDGRDDVLIGVLAHELGHVERRHGMRLLVQTTVLGAVSSLVWGDFSTLLATVPALLGQSAYSRDFEREADLDSIAMLRANGLSPALMAELFERLAKQRAVEPSSAASSPGGERSDDGASFGIAFASHPADAERIQAFRDAAR